MGKVINFKTFLILFILGILISCSHNKNNQIEEYKPVNFPDGGKGCCE